jgi:hypothetical protein
MKDAVRGLGDEKVTRQVVGGIMKTQSPRKMGMELFAAMLKAKRSTRTYVVCICLLHLLHRSSFHTYSYQL